MGRSNRSREMIRLTPITRETTVIFLTSLTAPSVLGPPLQAT